MKILKTLFISIVFILSFIVCFLHYKKFCVVIHSPEDTVTEELSKTIAGSGQEAKDSPAEADAKEGSEKEIQASLEGYAISDELEVEVPVPLTEDAVIIQEIDERVLWIREHMENFVHTGGEVYNKECYDGNIMVYRNFVKDADLDSATIYHLYYDEAGCLVCADITHYRAAMYYIYFQEDTLFYVEVGPFKTSGPFIKGDLAHAKDVIEENPDYFFVLEDLALCLEYAYK